MINYFLISGQATIILQSILVFLNVLLFLLTAFCGGFIGRTLDTSFQLRVTVD